LLWASRTDACEHSCSWIGRTSAAESKQGLAGMFGKPLSDPNPEARPANGVRIVARLFGQSEGKQKWRCRGGHAPHARAPGYVHRGASSFAGLSAGAPLVCLGLGLELSPSVWHQRTPEVVLVRDQTGSLASPHTHVLSTVDCTHLVRRNP
jgi:hypothetical protein